MKNIKSKRDKRSLTSKINGRKYGGRPKGALNKRTLEGRAIIVPLEEIKDAVTKGDLAVPIENALSTRFPMYKFKLLTTARINKIKEEGKGGVGDHYKEILFIDGCPHPIPWEIKIFFKEFIMLEGATRDFKFHFKLPKGF